MAIEIDPVCKVEVDTAKNPPTLTYKGAKYYFCLEGCRARFRKDPEQHIRSTVRADKAGCCGCCR